MVQDIAEYFSEDLATLFRNFIIREQCNEIWCIGVGILFYGGCHVLNGGIGWKSIVAEKCIRSN